MSQQSKTIQERITELEELVGWFDSDEFSLEQAVEKFHEVEKLAQGIEEDLTSLKNEVLLIQKKFDEVE